jgi:hypothetical protein
MRQSTVESFMNRQFKEIVTCTRACTVTSKVLIRAPLAMRLGFPNVRGKLVLIATNKGTLKAETPTRLSFVHAPGTAAPRQGYGHDPDLRVCPERAQEPPHRQLLRGLVLEAHVEKEVDLAFAARPASSRRWPNGWSSPETTCRDQVRALHVLAKVA